MSVSVEADVAAAIEAFRAYSVKAKDNLQSTMVKSAMSVEATAKKLFRLSSDPSVFGQPPRVQTGRLKASISHRLVLEGDSTVAEVGTNVEYAADLEFGTSLTMPHPFLTPALEMRRTEIENAIAKAVKDAGQ